VAVFDGEAYLRAVGEWWEPERHEPGVLCNPVLAATATALVAVDAITLGRAQAIIGDYSPAPAPGAAQDAASPPPNTAQLRVVPCDRVIDQPWGRLTIRYIVFTDQTTSLRVTLRPGDSQARQPGHRLADQVRRMSIADASGTTAVAELSGGFWRGELDWHGHYQARPPLAADTPWIELLGEQIQLTAEPVSIRAWTEPLPAQDPATRHLWERVATLNDFHNPHLALEATIAALTLAGAIPTDGSAAAARAALAVLRPDGASPKGVPGELPGPWHSLLARWGQRGGPVATIPVGAVTPSFDGVTAAVIDLESRDEHFSVNVELVPEVRTGLPYRDLPAQQHLTWWAADTLGNYYLGEQGSWDPRGGRGRGVIGFWPALDARASSIDLMPTATTARAVIRVPLPRTGR